MKILLVNDDGIHAPGLRAIRDALQELGDVQVVAPLAEQSGVGHGITYLHPIMVKEILEEGEHYGWAVDGSPADCVKMGVLEFCKGEPQLIVSGINSGANVGINVLYSGTVAAAIEGAFFGITSIALSLSQVTPPDYQATAIRAVHLIRQLLEQSPRPGMLWNVNFPATRPEGPKGIKLTTMAVKRHSDTIEKRLDPRGRPYYWSGLDPLKNHALEPGSDVKELTEGYVTVTPLHFDLTETSILQSLQGTRFSL
ncbi:5'/3'-nucleotidase SurE [Planctomicrobium sp. SH664]|uniref:5'/3'-nucleotidase SurE n=1 Tax=Planctomicrobium sp. SH664 TaxID=3448125 RepID=UPI003F5B4DAF